MGEPGGGGTGHGGAEPGRVDHRDRELRLPADVPALPERARRRDVVVGRAAPADLQRGEPVQQHRAAAVDVAPQVQRVLLAQRVALEPQLARVREQVHLQRHGRGVLGHRAQPLADDQVRGDVAQRHRVALAEDGEGRLLHLREPRQRAAAQRGQGLRQPHRLDHVRRRDGQVPGPQHARDLGEPAHDRLVHGGEEVVVPAGGGDPRPVARRCGQPRMRERHPGQRRLPLGQAAQRAVVGRRRWQRLRRAPARARHRRRRRPARRVSLRTARMVRRMCASRRSSHTPSSGASRRSSVIASSSAGNGDSASAVRDSTTPSHQRSGSS